jgi:hypothetical protein
LDLVNSMVGMITLNDAAPQFVLWHPHCRVADNSVICSVDVTPADTYLLDRGDDRLLSHFVDRLGFGQRRIFGWTIQPFSTPYYAADPSSSDLSERLSPAWRLRIEVSSDGHDVPDVGVSPIPAWGADSTWLEQKSPWDWNANDVVVIALNGPRPDTGFLTALDASLSVETIMLPGRNFEVSQLRISLGRLRLPEALERVDQVVVACFEQALVVHVDSAVYLLGE